MIARPSLAAGLVAALVAATAVAWGAVRVACDRVVRVVGEESLAESAKVFAAVEAADVQTLDATITRILSDAAVVDAFERRDRDRLAAIVRPVFGDLQANHGIDQLNFLLPDGTILLRAHRPREFGDVARRPVVTEAARTGEVAVGRDLGRTGFSLRVARPAGKAGRRLGFVEVGERTTGFLGRMKALTGDDYALVVEKRFLDRAEWAATRDSAGMRDGWDDLPAAVVVDATFRDPRLLRGWTGPFAALPPGGVLLEEWAAADRSHAAGLVPIWNAAAERVGGLLVRHDTTAVRGAIADAQRTLAFAFVALAAVGSMALIALSRRRARVAGG